MANNSTASYDIENLVVAAGHDSLKVSWDGFYNANAGTGVTGSGWTSTKFGWEVDGANAFSASASEKIAISVLDVESGVFLEQNKVILSNTDISNINDYTVEGLTAGKVYTVNLKAYKLDDDSSLRIYAADISGVPYTNPGMIEPVVTSTGSGNITVSLPGDYMDYFGTGLAETGYSALNYISIVIVEEGSSDIDVSNFVADDTTFNADSDLSWSFNQYTDDKTYSVRMDYENDTGLLMSTPAQQIAVGAISQVNALEVTTTGYHEISLNYAAPAEGQYSSAGSYQTKFEIKASDSYETTAAQFKNLSVLGSKLVSMADTPAPNAGIDLDLTQYGVNANQKLLELTSYYVVDNKDGAKKSTYIVLLPEQSTPWADMPLMTNFELTRGNGDFTISNDEVPMNWVEDLSNALVSGSNLNNLTKLDEMTAANVEYKFDLSNNALLSKDADTSKFNNGEDDAILFVFTLVHSNDLMGDSDYTYGAGSSDDFSSNNVVNVWKRTVVSVGDTTNVFQNYEYTAYQVKDRMFVNKAEMVIDGLHLTQNENVASLTWNEVANPVFSSETSAPYYFVGVSAEPLTNLVTTTDDACYNAVPGFALSDKNSSRDATVTVAADNSLCAIRVRPAYTVVNSDGSTDEIYGDAENRSFLPHKFSDIEVQVGVPSTSTLQENYPFGADADSWFSTQTLTGSNQVVLLKLSGGAGGVEELTGVASDPGTTNPSHHVVDFNFHVDLIDRDGTLSGDVSFDFEGAKTVGIHNTFTDPTTEWGMSGEYAFEIPAGSGSSEINNNKAYQVTVTQIVDPRDGGDNVESEALATFNLYGAPNGVDDLVINPEILKDVSGNATNVTGNLDISMMNLAAEYANSLELYRDGVLIKTVDPTLEETLGEILTKDTTGVAGAAYLYKVKTNYGGNFWSSYEEAKTTRDLVPYPLDLKNHGFSKIEIAPNANNVETDISFTVKSLPHTMYNHSITIADSDDGSVAGLPKETWTVDNLGELTTTNVTSALGPYELTQTGDAKGIALYGVPLATVKFVDVTYSVNLAMATNNGETVEITPIVTKDYKINNYLNTDPSNVVLKAVHTDDDNSPDMTLLQFNTPDTYYPYPPPELDNYVLTTDSGDLDISLAAPYAQGQIVPKSSTYTLKTNYQPSQGDETSSMIMHGESGLDTNVIRQHGSGVSLNMPTANAYAPPSDISIIDFGDKEGVLKIKVPSNVSGLILYRSRFTGDGGIVMESVSLCDLLDVSASALATNGAPALVDGFVAAGLVTSNGANGGVESSEFSDAANAPRGYLNLNFTNAGGEDHYFYLGSAFNIEYGESVGARFVYAENGGAVVSDLATRPFFSVKEPNQTVGEKITNINGNKVTFACDEETDLGLQSMEYKVEIYEVDGVEANQLNNYNIWDPSGSNVAHSAFAASQSTVMDLYWGMGSLNDTTAWKNQVWSTEEQKVYKQPIVGTSASNSSIVVESSLLKPNKLYVAKITSINQGVAGLASNAMLFDMHDTPESPSIIVKGHVGNKNGKVSVTVPIQKKSYMHDITLNHKSNVEDAAPSNYSHILNGAQNAALETPRKIIAQHELFGGGFDRITYEFSDRDTNPNDTGKSGAARINKNGANYGVFGTSMSDLDDARVGDWNDSLQFIMDVKTTIGGSPDADQQGALHDLTPPELVVAVHPHRFSDVPIVYSQSVGLFLQKLPIVTPPLLSVSSTSARPIARDEIHVGPVYTMHEKDDERNHGGSSEHDSATNGGPIDTLFIVAEYESRLEEGTVILTQNRSLDDEDWTASTLNKTFKVNNLPAGAMIVKATVYPVNEFGTATGTISGNAPLSFSS